MTEALADRLAQVRADLAAAAGADRFTDLRTRLQRAGLDDPHLPGLVGRVSHGPRDQDEVLALRRQVCGADAPDHRALFERYVLLRAAQSSLDAVPALPVPDDVKALLLDEYAWMTQPRDRDLSWFAAGTYIFSALCKLATLRRFPAGQMHWEVAGLPRSVLWRVRPREWPRLLRGIRELGGFRPAFVPHLAWRRKQIVLSEVEHYRSLHRMTGALALQPNIRGFVAFAWFYSPDAAEAAPHLAWAHRLFLEWGGTVVVTGPAGEESGIFEGAPRRRELASRGAFTPTIGLAIWPRSAMVRWARHFEATVRDRRGT